MENNVAQLDLATQLFTFATTLCQLIWTPGVDRKLLRRSLQHQLQAWTTESYGILCQEDPTMTLMVATKFPILFATDDTTLKMDTGLTVEGHDCTFVAHLYYLKVCDTNLNFGQ